MTGAVSGLVGIGGGVLLVPVLLHVFKTPMHLAAGTSLSVIIPTAILGAWTYFSRGQVDWRLAGWLAAGSIIGVAAGSLAAQQMSDVHLKRFFAVILLLVSIYIVFDAFLPETPPLQTSSGRR